MLDKSSPIGKPRLTPQIKREMKARQQAYARGDSVEYKERCEKVSGLVSKGENTKHYDQSKWYKAVYKLAVAKELGGVTPLPENVTDITERLQSAFIKPWKDIEPTEVPDVDDVVSLLKDNTPANHLLDKLNLRLNILIPEKQQELMEFPQGCLNAS